MGTTAKYSGEADDVCVICLSTVTERAVTVPCNHFTFDFVCLVSWLQERSTCPLCKAEVSVVQYNWQAPDDFKSYSISRTHVPPGIQSADERGHSSLFAPYGLPSRPRCNRRPFTPPNDDPALRRRREIYQKGLYSLHIGSNPHSGYRDVTPQIITGDSDLQSRARAFIRRELRVFSFLYTDRPGYDVQAATTSSNAEFLVSYVVSIVKMVDIKASNGHAENLLAEFLGRESARLFLHELNAWLRSPFSRLKDWDEEVQYEDSQDQ